MLTPSELRNAQFSKARLGGYVMSEVDKLLDEVTPDYEALYNENAELRKKVEVLLDRLDRYQEQEDSIKAAILNAQRMCDTIVAQARQQAALIEQDAKIKAGRVAEEAQRSIQDKHDELVSIRREVTQFRSQLVSLYRSHLEKIKEIPSFEEEGPSQQAEAGRPSDGLAQTGASSAPSLREDGQASVQLPDLEQTMEFTPPRRHSPGLPLQGRRSSPSRIGSRRCKSRKRCRRRSLPWSWRCSTTMRPCPTLPASRRLTTTRLTTVASTRSIWGTRLNLARSLTLPRESAARPFPAAQCAAHRTHTHTHTAQIPAAATRLPPS